MKDTVFKYFKENGNTIIAKASCTNSNLIGDNEKDINVVSKRDKETKDLFSILDKNIIAKIGEASAESIDELADHKNMMVVDCIQVSTGFNQNDHYFLPTELWGARNTSIYQLVDWMHDRDKILGCIIESTAKYQDGSPIEEDTEITDSDSFDVHNKMIVWKHIFEEEAAEIEEKASAGELFVSMECMFDNYDFALENLETGKVSIVARNEDTDFLTDHLRILGGQGTYAGHKVGIAFRDITFLGTGFVDDPANIRSEITEVAATTENNSVNNSDISHIDENSGVNNIELDILLKTGEENMDYKAEYEKLLADCEEADAAIVTKSEEIGELSAKVETLEAEAKDVRQYSSKDNGEDQYSYTTTDYDGNEVEVTSKTVYSCESVTTVTEELVADLTARKQELKEMALKVEDLDKTILDFETEAKNRTRKEAVASIVVEITDEELFAMTEDAFEAMVKFAPKAEAATEVVVEDDVVVEDEVVADVVVEEEVIEDPAEATEEEEADATAAILEEEDPSVKEKRLNAALAANIG